MMFILVSIIKDLIDVFRLEIMMSTFWKLEVQISYEEEEH